MLKKYTFNSFKFILSICIATPYSLADQTAQQTTFLTSPLAKNSNNHTDFIASNPQLSEFASQPWTSPKMGPFRSDDPILDEDPFFLRSQSWVNDTSYFNADGVHVQKRSNDQLAIRVSGAKKRLEINQALDPLFESEEYLFFKARSTDLFLRKASNDNYGEGLFFISKYSIEKESFKNSNSFSRPVPLFFLPLSGHGWTSNVYSLLETNLDILTLKNSIGEIITIEMDDLRKLTRVYENNLILASILELKHDLQYLKNNLQSIFQANGQIELPFIYPAKGSTAVFGTFFTGINLDKRKKSLHMIAKKQSILDAFFPKAYANDLLTPDVIDRLLIVGQITGTVFVTSFIAKYTILKERMTVRRKEIEAKEDVIRAQNNKAPIDRTTLANRIGTEGKELIDVFSHGLASLAGSVSIITGHILEYGADRFIKPGSKTNGMVRKFLEYTFLYNRKQGEFIAANAQTFFLGVVILGGIDTLGVVIQLLFVSPVFFPWVAQSFGNTLHDRVQAQFSGADTANNNVVTSEIFRNLTSYFISGAYSYSSSQRQKIMEDVRPVIEKQMVNEGKNPYSPKNHTELEARMEKVIESMLVERGLPGRSEFLFSAPSLARSLAHLMGFKVDKTGLLEDKSFVLEKARWGLIEHALKRAIKAANDLTHISDDSALLHTEYILRDIKKKLNVLQNIIADPKQVFALSKEAIEVRKLLTLMSYQGDVLGSPSQYIIDWAEYQKNPRSAELAAKLFRQAFFSLIEYKPYFLQPDQNDLKKHLAAAQIEADLRITSEIESSEITAADRHILVMEIVKQKIIAEEDSAEVARWKPAKKDWLEKYQAKMSDVYAQKAVLSLPADADDVTKARAYREAYREKMAKSVGLYSYSASNSRLVSLATDAALKEVESSIVGNPGQAKFYNSLSPNEQLKYFAHSYAKAYLDKYIEMTVSNSSVVSLTSPEQPGLFQWVRMTSFVSADTKRGQILNTTLRALESPFDNSAFKPGISSLVKRIVPWAGDIKATSEIKARTIVSAMTTGYFANYYMWQVKLPWDTYLFFYATGAFTYIASFWLDRIMINMGIRPMDTIMDKVKYSLIYTWLTYPTYIPFFFFIDDFKALTNKVSASVSSFVNNGIVEPTGRLCKIILGGG